MKSTTLASVALCSIAMTAISTSCGSSTPQTTEQKPSSYPVISLDTGTVTVYADYATELRSGVVVDIRPRVSGYIDKICVNEGSHVHKGEPMFLIDQADLRENVNSAQANVDAATAQVANAELEVRKLTPLVDKGIISPYELENAKSNLLAANAKLAYSESQKKNAEIDLGYANITSPVDGVVGRIIVREGTLVSLSTSDPLTTVSGSGDVSAYFSIDERAILELTSDIPGANMQDKISKLPQIQLIQSDGSIYQHEGRPELASGMVDMTTGSVQLKAVFPNPKGTLRTGSSGVVRIPVTVEKALLVPQKATFEMQDKRMVYVIDTANTVRARKITTIAPAGSFFIIKEGLSLGDNVIYEGIDKVREGQIIEPQQLKGDSVYNKLKTI